MHVNDGFLPEQQDEQGIIYHDIYSDDATGICGKYNLQEKSHDGYIYARLTKVMYGLAQAVRISHDALLKHL